MPGNGNAIFDSDSFWMVQVHRHFVRGNLDFHQEERTAGDLFLGQPGDLVVQSHDYQQKRAPEGPPLRLEVDCKCTQNLLIMKTKAPGCALT